MSRFVLFFVLVNLNKLSVEGVADYGYAVNANDLLVNPSNAVATHISDLMSIYIYMKVHSHTFELDFICSPRLQPPIISNR